MMIVTAVNSGQKQMFYQSWVTRGYVITHRGGPQGVWPLKPPNNGQNSIDSCPIFDHNSSIIVCHGQGAKGTTYPTLGQTNLCVLGVILKPLFHT